MARVDDLHRLLTEQQIGRTIDLGVVRGGARTALRVTPVEAIG